MRRNVTGNGPEDRVRRELAADLAPLLACPLLRGVLLEGVELQLGLVAIHVAHRLGRKPRGCLVTRAVGDLPLFFLESADERFLTLVTASAATVDLWVF